MGIFEIADMIVEPGELKFGRLPVLRMRDGSVLSIPLMVMQGLREGSRLWVDSASHGDEIVGGEVIRRILREEVNPKDLRGTIVAAPALNPWAFQVGSHTSPLYGGGNPDINSAFPGNPNGTVSERMAHRVFKEGILKCDHVISFHSNVYPAVEYTIVSVCDDRKVLDASIAFGEAYGLPMTASEHQGRSGGLTLAAQVDGKPGFVVELLAHGYLDERSIRIGTLGMLNALRYLGMLDGDVQPLPDLKVRPGRYGRGFIVSNTGGMVHFKKNVGDWMDIGEIVAIVRDVYGDVVEEVAAPLQGYLRSILFGGPHNEAVHEGSIIATILEADPNRRYLYD